MDLVDLVLLNIFNQNYSNFMPFACTCSYFGEVFFNHIIVLFAASIK